MDEQESEDNLGVTASQTTEPFPGDDPRTPLALTSSESEEEEFPDSQVSSGWMGKAITYYNRREKQQGEKAEQLLEELVKDLQPELVLKNGHPAELMEWLQDPETLQAYLKHCKESFINFGDAVYGILADRQRYVEWVSEWKCKAGAEAHKD